MSNNDNDEDEATIVLDFNKIKEQLAQEEENLVDPTSLDFTAKAFDISSNSADEDMISSPIILFDFKVPYFKGKFKTSKVTIISELADLNKRLRETEGNILGFYYNADPKVINQLVLQIKTKFPSNKILIIASKLSAEKAQVHKNSKFGANDYLSDPFESEDFFKKIKSLQ